MPLLYDVLGAKVLLVLPCLKTVQYCVWVIVGASAPAGRELANWAVVTRLQDWKYLTKFMFNKMPK